jgi:hypothetical protein
MSEIYPEYHLSLAATGGHIEPLNVTKPTSNGGVVAAFSSMLALHVGSAAKPLRGP